MIILTEHDGGIDGWDATKVIVAVYDTLEHAISELTVAGYTVKEFDRYYHQDRAKHFCMGAISYSLEEDIPFNEYDFPHK